METVAFFEKKISLTPSNLNELKTVALDEILLKKAKELIENKCSEQGFIVSGSIKLLSRSMGYYEAARFTGDTNYYVKLQGNVIYPIDGVRVIGNVIRKNKMGLYVNYNDAIRIQIPRDLHLGNREYDEVEIGMNILVELKRSKFAINDTFILASGLFITSNTNNMNNAKSSNKNKKESNKLEADEAEAEADEDVLPEIDEQEIDEKEAVSDAGEEAGEEAVLDEDEDYTTESAKPAVSSKAASASSALAAASEESEDLEDLEDLEEEPIEKQNELNLL